MVMPYAVAQMMERGAISPQPAPIDPAIPEFWVEVTANNTAWTSLRFESSQAITVEWGDGTANLSLAANTTASQSHTYTTAGRYRVRITAGYAGLIRLYIQSSVAALKGIWNFDTRLLTASMIEIRLFGNKFQNKIEEFPFSTAAALVTFFGDDNYWTGDIGRCVFHNTLTTLRIPNNPYIGGDLSAATYGTGIRSIFASQCERLHGDLATLIAKLPNAMQSLILGRDTLSYTSAASAHFGRLAADGKYTGNPASINWSRFTAMTELNLGGQTALSGNMDGWVLPPALAFLYIGGSERQKNTALTGDVTTWTIPNTLQWFFPQNAAFTGNLATLNLPDTVQFLQINGCDFTNLPPLINTPNVRGIKFNNLGLSQATLDAWISAAYTAWSSMTWTGWTPLSSNVTIDLTNQLSAALGANQANPNAVPSGVYANVVTPTTGQEFMYKMENDPDAAHTTQHKFDFR